MAILYFIYIDVFPRKLYMKNLTLTLLFTSISKDLCQSRHLKNKPNSINKKPKVTSNKQFVYKSTNCRKNDINLMLIK